MRTLVIETATAACSVALIEGGRVVARLHEAVGRGHAERLVPMIAELPGGGRADRILVDCGPGSFTGVRVGIAAARGLALGWGVPVSGYSSLALLAATALAGRPELARVAAVVEGGHGEVFMQSFAAPLAPLGDLASLKPGAALALLGDLPATGSGVRRLLALDPGVEATDALPDAAEARRLPPALAALPPRPIYGRAPDVKIAGGELATHAIGLRIGDARDIAAVDALMADAFDPRYGEAWTRGQCLGVLAMPGVSLTLADVDEAPAGFALTRRILDEAELLLLGVAPRRRRTGVGGALLRAVVAEAAGQGCAKLHLEVRSGNPAAHLYAAHGFHKSGERRGYYRGRDGLLHDAHSYSLSLPHAY